MLVDIGAEQPAYDWYVADNRSTILCLLDILAHQAAKNHCRPIIDTDASCYFARTKYRLIDNVWGNHHLACANLDRRKRRTEKRCSRQDRATVINETFEFDYLRDEIQIDCHTVRPDHGLNL